MLRIKRVEENKHNYLLMIGRLDHSIGTIDREALGCYTFRPNQLGSYSATFLRGVAEIVDQLNKEDEAALRRGWEREIN